MTVISYMPTLQIMALHTFLPHMPFFFVLFDGVTYHSALHNAGQCPDEKKKQRHFHREQPGYSMSMGRDVGVSYGATLLISS